ncbi:P2X purinoceptor 7-like [Dermacentor variabilis]|uniref:P2X purinoceptor 7-like n=1 Tax=Dermacentor variabilis TaxID=34621 RepID=UPI003F5C2B53
MENLERLRFSEEFGVAPYMYEPIAKGRPLEEANDAGASSALDENESEVLGSPRVGNALWCSCHHCIPMNNEDDCCCCQEINEITQKQKHAQCITRSRKFKDVCLNRNVLEVALVQQGTTSGKDPTNRQLRYAAYRQFAWLIWRKMGKHKRRILPSCVLCAIRKKYPSHNGAYTGFKHFSSCVEESGC